MLVLGFFFKSRIAVTTSHADKMWTKTLLLCVLAVVFSCSSAKIVQQTFSNTQCWGDAIAVNSFTAGCSTLDYQQQSQFYECIGGGDRKRLVAMAYFNNAKCYYTPNATSTAIVGHCYVSGATSYMVMQCDG
jgi:predicted Na+-dependent transporter